jgi:NAD(P)H-dependent flavin oxidoreductase YrpB (nitropropane dioxygenase family)
LRVERARAADFLIYPVGQIVGDMTGETTVRQVIEEMLEELPESKERLERLFV